jgi:hypothetical protein
MRMKIEEHWQELFGKPMPGEVEARVLKIQKALKIEDDDAVWQIVLALEFYQDLYQVWPESTRKEVEAGVKSLRETAVALTTSTATEIEASRKKAIEAIAKSQEGAKEALARAVDRTVSDAAQRAVDQIVGSTYSEAFRAQTRKWTLVGALLVVVVGGAGGWGFYRMGLSTGEAGSLAKIDEFRHFIACDRPGWDLEKKAGMEICYPLEKNGEVNGWRVK